MGVDSNPAGAVTLMPPLVANVVTFAPAPVSSAVVSSWGAAFALADVLASDVLASDVLAPEQPSFVAPAFLPELLESSRRELASDAPTSLPAWPAGEKICPLSCGDAITAPAATTAATATATATVRPRWARRPRRPFFSPGASCARCPA